MDTVVEFLEEVDKGDVAIRLRLGMGSLLLREEGDDDCIGWSVAEVIASNELSIVA